MLKLLKMVKIAKNGQPCQKWSKWSKIIQNGSKWAKWSKMVKIAKHGQNRQKWSKLFKIIQNGLKWSKIIQSGSKWSKMVTKKDGPNGQKLSKIAGLTLSGPECSILQYQLLQNQVIFFTSADPRSGFDCSLSYLSPLSLSILICSSSCESSRLAICVFKEKNLSSTYLLSNLPRQQHNQVYVYSSPFVHTLCIQDLPSILRILLRGF